MTQTLILLFHPALNHSRANSRLAQAAETLPGVTVVDLYGLYPDGRIDEDAEARRLLAADRIVLQFPIQWYSTPSLLKEWQDRVLTRMFYIDYEAEGRRLEGKPLLVAATAGNVEAAYAPGGRNLFPLPELLKPLRAMANRCGLPWGEPFLLFEANKLEEPALAEAARRYAARLADWIGPEAVPPAPRRSPAGVTGLAAGAFVAPLVLAAEVWLAGFPAPDLGWDWRPALGAVAAAPLAWLFARALTLARRPRRAA